MPRLRVERSDRALLRLVDLAYAAGEGTSTWEAFLIALSDAIGGRATVMMQHDLTSKGVIMRDARNDPDAARLYGAYYAGVDPRAITPKAVELALPGRAVTDQMLVPYEEFRQSEFYVDFARHYELARIICLCLEHGGMAFSGISVTRSEADGPFGSDAMGVLEAVAPHVRRALRVQSLIGDARDDRDAVLAAVESLALGVVGVGADGRVRFTNREASRIVDDRDGLEISRQELRASASGVTIALRRAIAEATIVSVGDRLTERDALVVPRPSRRPAYQIAVTSVRRHTDAVFARAGAAALVLIRDPERRTGVDTRTLQTYFGFTPAEARFAAALVDGLAPAEIAARHRLTRSTSRWFTEQIRLKTGVRTQAQAVAELMRSLALRAPRP